MIRVGLVGAGGMGSLHATIVSNFPDAQLVAVADIDQERARKLAEKLGAEVEPDPEKLPLRDDVDAVIVTTPTFYHAKYVQLAAEAGKHAFSEKPLARTMEQGEAMLNAVHKANTKLAVGQVVRWFPEYEQIYNMVHDGTLGEPATARTYRGTVFPSASRDWYADFELSGGCLVDMMVHDIDWLLWTFGPVERVYARRIDRPGYDGAMVSLRHANGVISYSEGNWCYNSFRTAVEVTGSNGLASTDNQNTRPLRMEYRKTEGSGPGVIVPVSASRGGGPYQLEDRDWMDWFQGGEDPRCTPEDALESLRVTLTAVQSADEGKTITLDGGK